MALSDEQLYEKAIAQAAEGDAAFLEMGKTLRTALDRDKELFFKIIKKTTLGPRKAYYLVNINRWFGDLPVSRPRLRAIGWTKLQVIGPYVTASNLDQLLGLAEELSTAQLKSTVKGEDVANNSHCVLMYFSPEQYQVFESALVKNGAVKTGRGIVDKEAALIKVLAKDL